MHAQNCIDAQEGSWSKSQPTLGASVRTSAFSSMYLADNTDAGAFERSKPQWDVAKDNEIPDLHRSSRSTPKPLGTPRLRSGGPVAD